MKRIIGLGAESHAAVVIELIQQLGNFEVAELLNDDDSIADRDIGGIAVCGSSEAVPRLMKDQGIRVFFIGVGSVRSREKKRELFKYAISCGLTPHTVIDPGARVSKSVRVGGGGCILAGAVISSKASLAENVTVNIGALVESDCIIQAHTQLGAGCYVGSRVHIGEGAYIGTGAIVQPNVHIGDNVVIGPGAVISEDVADGEEVRGARQILAVQDPTRPQPSHARKVQ